MYIKHVFLHLPKQTKSMGGCCYTCEALCGSGRSCFTCYWATQDILFTQAENTWGSEASAGASFMIHEGGRRRRNPKVTAYFKSYWQNILVQSPAGGVIQVFHDSFSDVSWRWKNLSRALICKRVYLTLTGNSGQANTTQSCTVLCVNANVYT